MFYLFGALAAALVGLFAIGTISLDIFSFLLFLVVVATVVYADRRKIKREGVILIRRSQRGINFIKRTADNHPRFWNGFYTVGAVLSIPVMIFISYLLLENAANII